MASGDRDERRGRKAGWDEARLRALRRHLGLTQQALATELGVRQQTVSEWETGVYRPRGASARLLGIVAERAGFGYEPASGPLTPENGGTTETSPNSRKHDGTAETSPDPRELDGPTKMVLNARTHDGSSGASPGLPDGGGR